MSNPRFLLKVTYIKPDLKKEGKFTRKVWKGEATTVDVLTSEDGPEMYFVFDGGIPVFHTQSRLFEDAQVLEVLVPGGDVRAIRG